MNPLEKVLTKRGEISIKDGEAIVNDVKLLLDNNAQEEINTLKSIGLDMDLRFAESKKEDIIIREKANEALERKVLHISEIKNFCLDYRLYMKSANQYAGRIPNDLGAELTRYCKEKKIVLPGDSSYSNFFIIAPPQMFTNYSSPGRTLLTAVIYASEQVKERRRLREQDPILIYQLPDNPDYYAVIKSWGSDFRPLRRVYGILTQRKWFKKIIFAIDCLVIYGIYIALTAQWNYFYQKSVTSERADLAVFSVMISIFILILAGLYVSNVIPRNIRRSLIRTVTGTNEGYYKN